MGINARVSRPTAEQTAIVRCLAEYLQVTAFAGTGKTSVLVDYAAARPDKRILYLAYNNSTAEEARRRFGRHVTCKTTHALAWHSHGRPYDDKLGNLREREIMRAVGVEAKLAHCILKTVEAYLHSDHASLEIDHVPKFVHVNVREEVLAAAKRIWADMRDPNRKDVRMSHDGYLKLYSLSRPDLSKQFDVILFDEAQDANPVTADIVRRQRGRCVVVLVGDPHQAIYGFRGAVDALSNPEGATVLPLTGCFRFGTDIALLNSVFLAFFKGEARPLQGLRADAGAFTDMRDDLPMTYIGRTNASIFRRAFEGFGRHRIHFVGGTTSYAFSKLLDVHRLSTQERPHDSFYRSFDSVDELNAYARAVKDKETCGLIKLLSQYGDDIPNLVERVQTEAAPTRDVASMIVSTTHKAKGLEFRQVTVESNDFEDLLTNQGELRAMNTRELVEEANLHYVAMTRATHALVPSGEFVAAMGPMISEWKHAAPGSWPPARFCATSTRAGLRQRAGGSQMAPDRPSAPSQ